jgi:hypothetical protein
LTNVSPARSSLGSQYCDLWGDSLLDRLVEDKRSDVLEALWRVDDPEVAGRIASRLAQSGIDELADLLAEEIVDSRMSQAGFEANVVSAVSEYLPVLMPAGTQLLAERLSEGTELGTNYEGARPVFEQGVLKQRDAAAEAFARRVIRHDTPASSDPPVRIAALRRLVGTASLDTALSALTLDLEKGEDGSWDSAIEAIEALADEAGRLKSESFAKLVADVVRAAPNEAVAAFSPNIERVVSTVGYGALKEVLSTDPLNVGVGATALATAAETVGRGAQRLTLFSTMVLYQSELYGELVPRIAPSWSEEEWAARLDRLTRLGSDAGLVASIVQFAPATQSATLIRLVAERSDEDDDLLTAVAEKVRACLVAGAGGDEEVRPQLQAIWWPQVPDAAADRVQAILVKALGDVNDTCRYVLAALKARKIGVACAARLIPEAAVDLALREIDEGRTARNLCAALHTINPNETEASVRALQQEDFSLDFADALAPKTADAALTGAREAWDELSAADRDRLRG